SMETGCIRRLRGLLASWRRRLAGHSAARQPPNSEPVELRTTFESSTSSSSSRARARSDGSTNPSAHALARSVRDKQGRDPCGADCVLPQLSESRYVVETGDGPRRLSLPLLPVGGLGSHPPPPAVRHR